VRPFSARLGSIRQRRLRRQVLTLAVDTGWVLVLLLLAGFVLGWLAQLRGI
jgi:hypothetical protein